MARKHGRGKRTKGFQPVKRPGALTARAKRAGMGTQAFARKNYHAGGLKGEQARFAVIAKKWHHGGRRKGGRR